MYKALLNMLLIGIFVGNAIVFQLPTPMPEEIAINEGTQQCAKVILGDECQICTLPEGWQILGYTLDATCPEGYEMIDLDLDCVEKENCQWNIGPGEETDNKPNLTLISSVFGLVCCGFVVLMVVIMLLIWWLNRHKKSKKYPIEESE